MNSGRVMLRITAGFLFVVGAHANLLTNPSFETPTVIPGSFMNFTTGSTGITGWTVTGPEVSIVSTTFTQNGVSFEAEDGNQWLDLTGDGANSTEGVQQTVTTLPSTAYSLTFFVGNTTGGGIFGTTSTVALKINGSQVGSFTNSNPSPTNLNWQQFTYNFTAATASTTLEFDNADPPTDNSNGLDLVDLELGGGAVPEPASIALVSLGAAALVLRRRSIRVS